MNILENMAKAYQNKEISLEEYAFNLANEYSRVCKSNYKLQERIDEAIERLNTLIEFWKKYNPIDNTMQVEQFKGVINILGGKNE